MNELNNALSFLQSKNIKMTINNEWFRECCQFYLSSNPHDRAEEIQTFVYDQWLLADLRELGEPCLPSHIPTSPKCRLDGKYALQVNEIINIGESGYSQFKRIRSGDAISTFCESEEKAPAWQPKHNRTLKLSLTDGALKLSALEFEPLAALREPFIPGLKILLIGPIECRHGVLLLTSKNIEILGGEVDSLLICNAVENILARKLNFDENPNPLARTALPSQTPDIEFGETESDVEMDLYLQDFENSLEPSRMRNDIPIPEDSSAIPIPSDGLNFNSPDFGNSTVDLGNRGNNISTVSYNQRQTEMNSRPLASSSMDNRNQDLSVSVSYERRTSTSTHSSVDDMDLTRNEINVPFVNEPRTLDMQSRISKCSNSSNWLQSNTCANASRKEKSPIIGVVTPIPSNKRNAESPPLQLDTKSSKIDAMIPNRLVREEARKNDLISVEQLKVTLQRQSPCTVKCFTRVTKLIKKPRIKNDKWLVITEVMDETDCLQVTFDDEFLQERIFMISACEVSSQKDKIAANPAVRDQIDELIRSAIVRLLELRGQFSIRIVPGNELPVVMNVVS